MANITYRMLLEKLKKFSEKELDFDVVMETVISEEVYAIHAVKRYGTDDELFEEGQATLICVDTGEKEWNHINNLKKGK